MIDFEAYIKMSKNNPLFVQNFSHVLHELSVAASSGQITEEQKQKYHYSLCYVYDGEHEESLNKAFNRMDMLIKHGYYNLNFTDKNLDTFLAARKTCVDYFAWVDLKRHKLDNSFIHDYLTRLANKVIEYSNGDELFWDYYTEFKTSCRIAVARGLVSRGMMDRYMTVLLPAMLHEYKVKSSIEEKKTLTMLELFRSDVKEESFDLDLVIVNLVNTYLTDLTKFNQATKMAHNDLFKLRTEGKIDDNRFARANALLVSYTSAFDTLVNCKPSDPLVTFNLSVHRKNFDQCFLYNTQQVSEAVEYSRSMVRTFTNEFLENELVIRILNEDMEKHRVNLNANKEFLELLTNSLKLLRDYDILTIQQYTQYLEAGKEKFR